MRYREGEYTGKRAEKERSLPPFLPHRSLSLSLSFSTYLSSPPSLSLSLPPSLSPSLPPSLSLSACAPCRGTTRCRAPAPRMPGTPTCASAGRFVRVGQPIYPSQQVSSSEPGSQLIQVSTSVHPSQQVNLSESARQFIRVGQPTHPSQSITIRIGQSFYPSRPVNSSESASPFIRVNQTIHPSRPLSRFIRVGRPIHPSRAVSESATSESAATPGRRPGTPTCASLSLCLSIYLAS